MSVYAASIPFGMANEDLDRAARGWQRISRCGDDNGERRPPAPVFAGSEVCLRCGAETGNRASGICDPCWSAALAKRCESVKAFRDSMAAVFGGREAA